MSEMILNQEDMLIAEDTLIGGVQFAIHNLLESKGISRAELARRLKVTDAYVSQMFKDNTRNLTLRTVARIFFAAGEEPRIVSSTLARLFPSAEGYSSVTIRHRESDLAKMFSIVTNNQFHLECNDNEAEKETVAEAA